MALLKMLCSSSIRMAAAVIQACRSFDRLERQLGDAVELVFVGGDVVHALEGREDPAFVVGHVELPVLELAGQPGADRPVHIPPVVVELLQRDPVPLP